MRILCISLQLFGLFAIISKIQLKIPPVWSPHNYDLLNAKSKGRQVGCWFISCGANGDRKPIMRKRGWGMKITHGLKLKIISATPRYSLNKATYPRRQEAADALKQTTGKCTVVGFLDLLEHLLRAY